MTDLIRSKNSGYEKYEDLLLERDQLNKEAGQIWTVYQKLFGQLITDIFEEKVECIKNKKIIAYYQAAVNHGGDIDADEMQRYMDREMALYYAELRRMLRDKENAQNAGTSSAYDAKRSRELYRRLAKLLHPDLNPLTDTNEELQDLWNRTVIAYGKNDVKELAELEVLVRKTLKELGAGDARADVPDIEEKIEALHAEIELIRTTEPYTLWTFVEDEEARSIKRQELQEELESYQDYRKELSRIILQMLNGGDIKIHVN